MADNEEAGWAKVEFAQSRDDLVQNGPTLRVSVERLPLSDRKGATVLAQIDTGADGSAIPISLAGALGLQDIGTGKLREAGRDIVEAPYYRISLLISKRFRFPLEVVGLAAGLTPPHDLLIGRDVLSNGILTADFTTGLTVFRFRTGG